MSFDDIILLKLFHNVDSWEILKYFFSYDGGDSVTTA